MKVAAPPSRRELAAWCRERAEANRRFDGKLTQGMMVQIRQQWPAYFLAIAALLEDQPTAEPGA